MNVLHAVRVRLGWLQWPGWQTTAIFGGLGMALALYLWATFLNGVGSSAQLPFPLLLLVLGIYEVASRKQGLNRSRMAGWLLLALTLFLLGAKLYKTWNSGWNSGPSGWYSIAGFTPVDDALGYFQGARNLLEHGFLDEWSARKPMVANYYALLLLATGHNLPAVIVVNNLLLALSIYMFSRWIYERFGPTAALVALLLEAFFIMPFAPTLMTEIPGLCFGNFAFLLLAQGAHDHKKSAFLLGLCFLGVAFTLRAGALFALPALAIAGGWVFAGPRKFNVRVAALCVGAIGLPFFLGMVQLRLAGPPAGGVPNGNFATVLYGIIQGNKGWDYFKTVHPELVEMTDSQRHRILYGLVRQELKERPFALFSALARSYCDALKDPYGRLYRFPFPMSLAPFLIPFVCFFIGLVFEKNESRRRLWVVLGAAQGSIFLSLPFIADGGYRVFAATVPISGGVLAVGIKRLMDSLRAQTCDASPAMSVNRSDRGAAYVPIALLAAMLCMPMIGKMHRTFRGADLARTEGPPGTVPLRIHSGSLLLVVPDDARTRIAIIRGTDFQKYGFEDQAIRSIQPGEWLASGMVDLHEGARFYRFVIFEDSRVRDGIAYCRLTPVGDSQQVFRARVVRYAADER